MKKGSKMSKESCKKISLAGTGRIQSNETRMKISMALKGVKKSKEHRENISAGRMGEKNPQWKGGKTIRSGYVLVNNRKHPLAINGYVREHRLVMEKHIGRYLLKGEIIHHINGNTLDNRIENLILCISPSEHINKFHKFLNPNNSFTLRQCYKCKIIFPLTKNNFHYSKNRQLGFEYLCKKCKAKKTH